MTKLATEVAAFHFGCLYLTLLLIPIWTPHAGFLLRETASTASRCLVLQESSLHFLSRRSRGAGW